MRICFLVNAVRSQRHTYTTIHLAYQAARRGHDVYWVGIDDLSIQEESRVMGYAIMPRTAASLKRFWQTLTDETLPAKEICLSDLEVVFLRNNPVTVTSLETLGGFNPAIDFGRRLRRAGVTVVNDPDGLVRAGSKMYLAGFAESMRPRTLVSRNGAKIKEFLRELDGPAILKPLAAFGGKNVFYVRRGQIRNLNQMIDAVRKEGYVIAQEYLPDAERGDKRVLLLAGDPIRAGGVVAAYKRMRPKDDIRNNMHIGGHRKRCVLSEAEWHLCAQIKPRLLSDGLYFVGVDLVGDKILEINVYAPGGIHNINELYGINVGETVIADLETRIATRLEPNQAGAPLSAL